ncbi:MAG: NFACT family protein, partial [Nanoarchaeota archaeon]
MKKELSSIELRFLVAELQQLKNSYVDKVYNPEGSVVFALRTPAGKNNLYISSAFVWLSSKRQEMPEKISHFCEVLRKHLENSKISEVKQLESERIILITFNKRETAYLLYVELFGDGNVILCHFDEEIILPLTNQEWKDRKIFAKEKYIPPPARENVFKMSEEEFKKNLHEKEAVSKSLAMLGLGSIYSEEICLRAGVDKKKTKLSKEEKEMLFKSFKDLLNESLSPRIIYEGGEVIDIVPLSMRLYSSKTQKNLPNYAEALESVLMHAVKEQIKVKGASKYEEKISKLKNIVNIQEKSLVEIEKKSKELQSKGDFIYNNYEKIKKLLDKLNKAKKEKGFLAVKEVTEVKEVNEVKNEVRVVV